MSYNLTCARANYIERKRRQMALAAGGESKKIKSNISLSHMMLWLLYFDFLKGKN